MRAVVITKPGGPEVLELREVPTPMPGTRQVRVRVHAAGLNRADLLQRRGHYPPPPGAPADIPGLEYAGEVDAVGDGVTMWKAGDRVMGITGGGAHAEALCVHEREAIAIPDGFSWTDAAAIPEVFLTAYDALSNQLGLRAGETVLIHAVGSGVGTAALQLARMAGARVIGTSRSASKLERARALGLSAGVDTSAAEWASQVHALMPGGVNAIVDLVGAPFFEDNLRLLAARGRMVVVGTTAGSAAQLDMGLLLRKRLRLVGTVLRARPLEEKIALAREFADRIMPSFSSGALEPVVDRVASFADVARAHDAMERSDTFGKVVLRWEQSGN